MTLKTIALLAALATTVAGYGNFSGNSSTSTSKLDTTSTSTTSKPGNSSTSQPDTTSTSESGNSSIPTAGYFIQHDAQLSSFFDALVEEPDLYNKLLGPEAGNYTVFAPTNDAFARARNDTLKTNKSIKEYLQSSIVKGIQKSHYNQLSDKDKFSPLRTLYTIAIRTNKSGTFASLVNTGDVFSEFHSVKLSNNKTAHLYFESSDGIVYVLDRLLVAPPGSLTVLAIVGIIVAAAAAGCLIIACIVNLVRQKRDQPVDADYQELTDDAETGKGE